MKKVTLAALLVIFLPSVTHAQTVQDFLINTVIFLSEIIVPALMGIAFLFFVVNAIRFFVAGSTNEKGRENAKNLAIYGILAFVLIVIFWGVINLLSSSIGLDGCDSIKSDYVSLKFVGPLPTGCP